MKTFKITTHSTCITTYLVDADTEAQAEELFWEGAFYDEDEIDFQNEDIFEVEEIEQSNG